MTSRTIHFLIVEGYQALDLAGPMAVFSTANDICSDAYDLVTLGLGEGTTKSNAGLTTVPDARIHDLEPPHTLVFVGGPGARTAKFACRDTDRLRELAQRSTRVISICTGSFIAAQLGLLDDHVTTTHWRHQDELQKRFRKTKLEHDRLYTVDGKYWSSAGVTAGIDLALAIVREDLGDTIAASIARQLVVYLHRDGGQNQYSEGLRVQHGASGAFSELIEWVRVNLSGDLTISVLAARMGMSPRNFQRRFKTEFGVPATTLIERLRIDHARDLLRNPSVSIAAVAAATGFKSPDSFRRAFERVVGVGPRFHQKRFQENDMH